MQQYNHQPQVSNGKKIREMDADELQQLFDNYAHDALDLTKAELRELRKCYREITQNEITVTVIK